MKYPEFVIVDHQDGTVYHKDYRGDLFDLGGAVEFMDNGNAALKNPTLKVYGLKLVTEEDIISAAEQQASSRYRGDGTFADNH